MTEQTQLTVNKNDRYDLAPRNFEELKVFAEMMSQSQFVPKAFQGKPGDIIGAIQYGSEVGLAPLQSLQNIAVINGKPSLWGDAIPAICMSHPAWEGYEENYDEATQTATCTVRRKGMKPVVQKFSKADAQTAGLLNRDTYKSYLRRMLQQRARGFAFRDAFPDALKGLISREEALDYPPMKDVTPTYPVTTEAEAVTGEKPGLSDEQMNIYVQFISGIESMTALKKYWSDNYKEFKTHGTDAQYATLEAAKDERKKALGKSAAKLPVVKALPDLPGEVMALIEAKSEIIIKADQALADALNAGGNALDNVLKVWGEQSGGWLAKTTPIEYEAINMMYEAYKEAAK